MTHLKTNDRSADDVGVRIADVKVTDLLAVIAVIAFLVGAYFVLDASQKRHEQRVECIQQPTTDCE